MKKILFSAVALLSGALIFSLSGCSLFSGNPYEVATRDDSNVNISQIQTKSQARVMYEEACADGYSGSFVDFLKEIGVSFDDSLAVNSDLLCTAEVYAAFEVSQLGMGSSYYYSIGSGVFLEADTEKGDAYVVTNYHVVYNAKSTGRESIAHVSDNILLYLYGGKTDERGIKATYVGGAMNYDIAVLKVENSDLLKESDVHAATIADSDEVTVGERVYAVGNPNSKGVSAVSGILSVEAEYITLTAADERTKVSMLELRTDAPVNHGNSGGGLFNAAGELIGVVNARSEESGVEHLGYAIPSNLACAVAYNVIDNSKADNSRGVMCATLGITVETADTHSEYDEKTGKTRVVEEVKISKVNGGLAAGKLKAGDVILSVKIGETEKEIVRRHMFMTAMLNVRRGDTVVLTVLRGGKQVEETFVFSSNDDFTLMN